MHSGVAVKMLSPWEEGGMCDPHSLRAILTEERLEKALQDIDFSGLPAASTCKGPVGVDWPSINK